MYMYYICIEFTLIIIYIIVFLINFYYIYYIINIYHILYIYIYIKFICYICIQSQL